MDHANNVLRIVFIFIIYFLMNFFSMKNKPIVLAFVIIYEENEKI